MYFISAGIKPCRKLCFRSDVSHPASALATRHRQFVLTRLARGQNKIRTITPTLIVHIPPNSYANSTRAADVQGRHNVAESANVDFWLLHHGMQDDPRSRLCGAVSTGRCDPPLERGLCDFFQTAISRHFLPNGGDDNERDIR